MNGKRNIELLTEARLEKLAYDLHYLPLELKEARKDWEWLRWLCGAGGDGADDFEDSVTGRTKRNIRLSRCIVCSYPVSSSSSKERNRLCCPTCVRKIRERAA